MAGEELRKEEIFALLKKVSEMVAPSGFEEDVRGYVREFFSAMADSVYIDAMGNVVAVKKGSRGSGKIMMAGHMDEIGLFISHIDDRGFL